LNNLPTSLTGLSCEIPRVSLLLPLCLDFPMANGKSSKNGKGKRRASHTPSPNLSSSESEATMGVPATQPSLTHSRKKPRRQSSPERVMGSVLSKATKRPKKGSGLAALVALVATRGREGSTAAKGETNKGLRNAAKRPKAKNRTRSAVIVCYHNPIFYFDLTILLYQDDGFRVGKIAFLREGIKIVSTFLPVISMTRKANIFSRQKKA
jgi:hypothetical protein